VTLRVYAHWMPQMEDDIVNAMSDLLWPNTAEMQHVDPRDSP